MGMFSIVEMDAQLHITIVYCRKTRVMYSISAGYNNNGIMTVLLNPDGTPMLYEREDKE